MRYTFQMQLRNIMSLLNIYSCGLLDGVLKNEKAEFKVTVRKYLHTYFFYVIGKFLMCQDDP